MFISDVIGNNKEEIYDVIVQDLRQLGVKHRIKKASGKHSQHNKHGHVDTKLFKVPLNHLEHEVVILTSGAAIEVPSFIIRACNCIKESIETEGIFRKAGSTARQRELKAFLDGGKQLGPEHNAIDVANILKLFFRELPEPLIPFAYHDVLLRCLLLKEKQIEGLLLICLLIPTCHLNALSYLMQFFKEVASYSNSNKMDIKNLAIIITPSLMPVEEKVVANTSVRLGHHVQVVELLIRHAEQIGSLPENVSEKLAAYQSLSHDEQDDDPSKHTKKKKKRRSGSLTRMLNGLKKMVGKGSPEVEENHLITSTPDFSTPCVKSSKKRKAEVTSAFSSKKKKDVLQMLPQSVALANIPYTPSRSMAHDMYVPSPVCAHPNPLQKTKSPQSVVKIKHRRFFTPKLHADSAANKLNGKDLLESCKKSRLSLGGRSGKKQKPEGIAVMSKPSGSDVNCHKDCASENVQEGRWSWGRKKHLNLSDVPMYSPSIGAGVDITSDEDTPRVQNSSANTLFQETHFDLSNKVIHVSGSESMESEFVRISKSEYEEIKNRVIAIEDRISQEFGNMAVTDKSKSGLPNTLEVHGNNEIGNNNAELVQSAYERTLEESCKLDDGSTDHLARRLSKELRIRRSLENKIIRSPSARKIGSIRRRSRENTKPLIKRPERNMSWHLAVRPSASQISQLYPRSNLRRGRPNTVYTGLPQPNPRNIDDIENTRITLSFQNGLEKVQNSSEKGHVHPLESNMGMNLTDFQYHAFCNHEGGPLTRSRAKRASSFHGTEWAFYNENFISDFSDVKKSDSLGDIAQNSLQEKRKINITNNEMKNDENWQAADTFFKNSGDTKQEPAATGRASIAKLRSQNAGMVMERKKMFDPKTSSKLEYKTEKTSVNGKSKKPVHVPSVFVRNTAATQSQRFPSSRSTPTKRQGVSKMNQSQSAHKFNSSLRTKAVVKGEAHKDSPKKLGTPRRKQSVKSPSGSLRRQKLKIMKSPSKVDPNCSGSVSSLRRKHNSMKIARDKVYTIVKANHTAPEHWLSTEKENVQSPAENAFVQSNIRSHNVRERKEDNAQFSSPYLPNNAIRDINSPAVDKVSKMGISPLKDCNRIRVNNTGLMSTATPMQTSTGYRTPKETPYIKKPLLTKSPSQISRTPQSVFMSNDRHGRRHQTPMKALPSFGTPVGSPKKQSPRLLLLKSRNIS